MRSVWLQQLSRGFCVVNVAFFGEDGASIMRFSHVANASVATQKCLAVA